MPLAPGHASMTLDVGTCTTLSDVVLVAKVVSIVEFNVGGVELWKELTIVSRLCNAS